MKIAKSTDGTDIDTAVAKFATTAEMHGDIRQMIFKEVIEARHSLASIPILREYVAKTGKGRDTLERVELLNGIQTAPTPANAQTPATVAANPSPKPNPAPKPNPTPKPNPQPAPNMPSPTTGLSPTMNQIAAALKGDDDARKIESIAALGRSEHKSAQLMLLELLKNGNNEHLRPQIFAALIELNRQPLRLENEVRAKQSWRQFTWLTETDDERHAVTLALKDITSQWSTELLGELFRNKGAPKTSKLAGEILANRKK